jgi:putative FmdB family regulatory protein
MPTYEYECTKGHTFEVVQRITEDSLTHCQVCRAKAKRVISSANFILKGGGWYSDGYASGKKKSSDSSSASDSSSGSSSGSSSDSSSGSDSGSSSGSSSESD